MFETIVYSISLLNTSNKISLYNFTKFALTNGCIDPREKKKKKNKKAREDPEESPHKKSKHRKKAKAPKEEQEIGDEEAWRLEPDTDKHKSSRKVRNKVAKNELPVSDEDHQEAQQESLESVERSEKPKKRKRGGKSRREKASRKEKVRDAEPKKLEQSEDKGKRKWIKQYDQIDEGQAMINECDYRVTYDKNNREVIMRASDKAEFRFTNSEEYNKLADYLIDYIQGRMYHQYVMDEKVVPFKKDLDTDFATTPIFVSPDWKTNTKGALVLIQGTGDVRPGVWARSVCINDSLDNGSMLPQIKFAVENGMACLILNPNFCDKDENDKEIDPRVKPGTRHCLYVWKKYVVERCGAEEIFVLAHSKGGKWLEAIYKRYTPFFAERVTAVALTDSVHKDFRDDLIDQKEEDWLEDNAIHFIRSSEPLDTEIPAENEEDEWIPTYSAGHPKHEYTTGTSWMAIQDFFSEKSKNKIKITRQTGYSKHSYPEKEE